MISATRTAMIAITTSNSINVKAALDPELAYLLWCIRVPSDMRRSFQLAPFGLIISSYTIRSIVAIALARFLFIRRNELVNDHSGITCEARPYKGMVMSRLVQEFT